MQVREVMTTDLIACDMDATLEDIASAMVTYDCGLIPILDAEGLPIGTVTDRDITCRAVANHRNPLELRARDVMTTPVVCVDADEDLEECARLLERHQIRRILVRDREGRCCGIVAQADIAREGPRHLTAEIVREISEPSASPAFI